jgi:cytochrome P450
VRRLVDASLAQAAGEGEGKVSGERGPPGPAVVELARRGAPGGRPLPRPALDAHAAALTLAGADAAGHAAAWAVALLAAHPAAAARAEAELAAGGWLAGGSGRAPLSPLTAADVAPSATGGGTGGRLPYLRACLLEAVRLFPPAPAAVRAGGESGSGGSGGDCGDAAASPPAPAVVISPHAWHRCPAHFGAPATFLPERWLVDGAEWMGGGGGGEGGECPAGGGGGPRRWRRFAPFGEGARACPGAALATSFGVALLASLVGRFRWRLVVEEEAEEDGKGAPPSSSPAALVAHLHTRVAATAVTLAPAGGLWVVAEAR